MQLAKGTRTPTSLRTAKLVASLLASFFPPLFSSISPLHSSLTLSLLISPATSLSLFPSLFFFFKHEYFKNQLHETGGFLRFWVSFEVRFFDALTNLADLAPFDLVWLGNQHLAARNEEEESSAWKVYRFAETRKHEDARIRKDLAACWLPLFGCSRLSIGITDISVLNDNGTPTRDHHDSRNRRINYRRNVIT